MRLLIRFLEFPLLSEIGSSPQRLARIDSRTCARGPRNKHQSQDEGNR